MSPKKNQNPSKTRNQINQAVPEAMAKCVFPEEIMFCILTRLPVKSLLRFKSVCKPWLKLLATPYFIKSHHHRFSSHPENQNFMIYSHSDTSRIHTMSLFRIESDEKKATTLNHPHPETFYTMNFVGCCNGLVCMAFPPIDEGIVLWNPAMQLSKHVPFSKPERTDGLSLGFGYDEEGDDFKVVKIDCLSLGFGYDEEGDDFKVVKIDCLRGEEMEVGVEVYSTKSGSWETIKVDLQFRAASATNDAIVGGNPYWAATDVSGESQIVWFDVKKMVMKMVGSPNVKLVFKTVPFANDHALLMWEKTMVIPLIDWKGCVATILHNIKSEREEHGCVRIMAFDKDAKKWNRDHLLGPIELKADRCLQCSKSGKFIGVCDDGKLFVFDPESRGVKVFEVEEAPNMSSFQIHEYNESLAFIQGMEAVAVKTGEDKQAAAEVAFINRVHSFLQLHEH